MAYFDSNIGTFDGHAEFIRYDCASAIATIFHQVKSMPRPVNFRLSPFPVFLLLATTIAILALIHDAGQRLPDFLVPTGEQASPKAQFDSSYICHPCAGPQVHSASVVEGKNGDLFAVWFGGSREGARDVRIYASRLIAGTGKWSHESSLLDRKKSGSDLHRFIKKLGNPVLGRSKDGRLWLFYVTVSAGGWSGSAINYRISADNGKTWSVSRRLVTTPFFNVSTLVHGLPVARTDGTLTVPVYHELLGKFSEMLRVDKNGRVLSKKRVSHGKQSFQPTVVALGGHTAVMLARSASPANRHIFISLSHDAGKNWSEPVPTSLPNPDAGIAVTSGRDKSLLVVYNDSQHDRSNLALAVSHDTGKTWKRIFYFEKENVPNSGEEYSYPMIIHSGDQYHLVYTWRRKGIRYIHFNSEWVIQQEGRR